MIHVDAEVSKYKNIKDRDELGMAIKEYKNLALQHASNLFEAGQYSEVAHKLQEIYDKLPEPPIQKHRASAQSAPVKTATITDEEQSRIDAEWRKKTKK